MIYYTKRFSAAIDMLEDAYLNLGKDKFKGAPKFFTKFMSSDIPGLYWKLIQMELKEVPKRDWPDINPYPLPCYDWEEKGEYKSLLYNNFLDGTPWIWYKPGDNTLYEKKGIIFSSFKPISEAEVKKVMIKTLEDDAKDWGENGRKDVSDLARTIIKKIERL